MTLELAPLDPAVRDALVALLTAGATWFLKGRHDKGRLMPGLRAEMKRESEGRFREFERRLGDVEYATKDLKRVVSEKDLRDSAANSELLQRLSTLEGSVNAEMRWIRRALSKALGLQGEGE
jgi:hypothetical protein